MSHKAACRAGLMIAAVTLAAGPAYASYQYTYQDAAPAAVTHDVQYYGQPGAPPAYMQNQAVQQSQQPVQVAGYNQQPAYAAQASNQQVPRYVPPSDPDAVNPNYMGLETRQGIDVGLQAIYYRYREPEVDVTELGPMAGFTAAGTVTFWPGYFASANVRYALGSEDYRGSGTEDDKWNDLWEVQLLAGHDFMFPTYSLSPFIGLGFRELYDDNRGRTTINAFGYRRENQIYYLPIGVMPRTHIDANSRLTGLLEYDILLHGSQTSYLSDGGFGDPNVENQQHSGFGIRGNVMYDTRWWSVGPFFNYWDIDQSKVKIFSDSNPGTCASIGHSAPCTLAGVEPKNHTIEMGLQAKFHVF